MNWSNVIAEEHVVLLIKGHVEPGFVIGEVVVPLMVSLAGHVRHLAGNGLYLFHEYVPSESIQLSHVIGHVTHMNYSIKMSYHF